MIKPISDSAIALLAEAIFKKAPVAVVEAYSSPGTELRDFKSPPDVCQHARAIREAGGTNVHLAVLYEDMGGELSRVRIDLVSGTFRFKSEGWGLIWVYLELQESPIGSFISTNTESRAHTWEAAIPEMGNASSWNWSTVNKHLQRLQRVLKRAP